MRSPVWQAGPGRLDERDPGVRVAVVAQRLQPLDVPGGRALVPELLARARPEPHLAGLARARERLLVHVRERQHLAGARVLNYAGQQLHRLIMATGRPERDLEELVDDPDLVEAEPPVELLRPVVRVREQEHGAAPGGMGVASRGEHRRARVAATAARLDRAHLVDLGQLGVHVEAAAQAGSSGGEAKSRASRARP